MLTHLIAVIALAVLCGAWVLFQRWLKRVDPDARGVEDASGCSGNCRPDRGVRGRFAVPIRAIRGNNDRAHVVGAVLEDDALRRSPGSPALPKPRLMASQHARLGRCKDA